MKPVAQSRTTQNVTVGAATGGTLAASLVALINAFAPMTPEVQSAATIILGAVLIPLVSRLAAKLRNKEK